MVTSSAIPVEEYLRTSYDPDREYVAGQLVERHTGEYDHGYLQSLPTTLLNLRGDERGFRAFTEQRVSVSDEPRFRIPDICIKALPHAKTAVLIKPDLAIEIVSPDDTPVDMIEKIGDYQRAGIPYIWVADPYKRLLIEADGEGIHKPAGLVLSTPLVGDVDFDALFRKLDRSPD